MLSLETLAHEFSIHGDEMSPEGRRQVAEAIKSGQGFIIVLSRDVFKNEEYFPPKAFAPRFVQLSEADWIALFGFKPTPKPVDFLGHEVKQHPALMIYAETLKVRAN